MPETSWCPDKWKCLAWWWRSVLGVARAVHAVHLVLLHWIFIFSSLWLTDASFYPSFRIHISVAVDQSSPSTPSYKHRRDLSLSITFYHSNFSRHVGGEPVYGSTTRQPQLWVNIYEVMFLKYRFHNWWIIWSQGSS